jgi:uncharacterized membrane protein YqhA
MQSDTPSPEPIIHELSEDGCSPHSHEQYFGENLFERALWSSRYIVLIAVVFSVIGAFVLFFAGTLILIETVFTAIILQEQHISISREVVLIGIIESIDFYLIAVALMIFSFGLYELFISNINIARKNGSPLPILRNESLGRLKSNIIHVIIMVLIVTFFQRVLSVQLDTIFELFMLALSIFVISIGVFYVQSDE